MYKAVVEADGEEGVSEDAMDLDEEDESDVVRPPRRKVKQEETKDSGKGKGKVVVSGKPTKRPKVNPKPKRGIAEVSEEEDAGSFSPTKKAKGATFDATEQYKSANV
jgi:hypothetical protein